MAVWQEEENSIIKQLYVLVSGHHYVSIFTNQTSALKLGIK